MNRPQPPVGVLSGHPPCNIQASPVCPATSTPITAQHHRVKGPLGSTYTSLRQAVSKPGLERSYETPLSLPG